MRFALDRSARRLDGGRVLLGGSPLRLFRLTPAGTGVVDRIERGDDLPPATAALTDRLLDAGAIHPRPTGSPFGPDDVTVVVPVLDADPTATLAGIGHVGRVLVVDDGSARPVTAAHPAEVVRRDTNGGPAAARNTGLASVDTPLVAFVDVDCRPEPGWLEPLLAHLADPRVGVVAPRVTTSGPARSVLARYEAARSPLDLGPVEGRIRAGSRISYVPAAALLVRSEAVRAVGGFDEALRTGEDVDLVWRLDEAGWRGRYEPAAVVRHEPRTTWVGWVGQRVGYGRSAGPLDRRHPGALAPVRANRWSLVAWGLAAAGAPLAGVAVAAATAGLLARRLRPLDHPAREAARLGGLGHLHAGRWLASALVRAWWPLVLPAALVSRRARRVLVVAAVVPALLEWRERRPDLDPPRFVALHVADDLAYGVGLWLGCLQARTTGPLLPAPA